MAQPQASPLDSAIARLEAMYKRSGYAEVKLALDELREHRAATTEFAAAVAAPIGRLRHYASDQTMQRDADLCADLLTAFRGG